MVNCLLKMYAVRMLRPIMKIKRRKITGRKICLIAFFLLLCFNYCRAQEVQKKYSITKKSKNSYPSKIEDDIGPLISKAEAIMSKDPAAAVETIENALTESIKTGDRFYEAQCYRVLGAINLKSNLTELAIKNSLKAFQILAEMKEEASLSIVRVQLADCYERSGNNEEALRLYSEQFALYKKNTNEREALKTQYKIAQLYFKQAKLKQALSNYQEILTIEQKKGNKEGIVEANNKIGEIFEKQSNNQQALEYYNRAQNIAENSNDIKSINSVNENISSVLKKEKKYEEEITVRKRGLE